MTKKICTLLILFSTMTMSSQNNILFKNFNPKAKELKHNLNHTKDSLVLAYDKLINIVEIFNEDYEKTTIVQKNNVKVPLDDLPVGKFVVEVTLVDRIIVMGLLKQDYYDEASNSNIAINKEEVAEGKGMMLDEGLKVIKSSPHNSIEYILTRGKTKSKSNKSQKFYWTVTKTNSEIGSSKTMRLVDQACVDRMILKNKLEYKSASGNANELTVWEVYDTTKFMENQVVNPNFMYSQTSEFFNTSPYYTTENSTQNI